MKHFDFTIQANVLGTTDSFLGSIDWTKRRQVILFLREHRARRFVKMRTFLQHQVKKCWYPARSYTVPIECAYDLGRALIRASDGEQFTETPDWWHDFLEQYDALPRYGTNARKYPTASKSD